LGNDQECLRILPTLQIITMYNIWYIYTNT
jgi:hypothetical protein